METYTNEQINTIVTNHFNDAVMMHVAKRIATAAINGTEAEKKGASDDYKQHVGIMNMEDRAIFDSMIMNYTWNLTA